MFQWSVFIDILLVRLLKISTLSACAAACRRKNSVPRAHHKSPVTMRRGPAQHMDNERHSERKIEYGTWKEGSSLPRHDDGGRHGTAEVEKERLTASSLFLQDAMQAKGGFSCAADETHLSKSPSTSFLDLFTSKPPQSDPFSSYSRTRRPCR